MREAVRHCQEAACLLVEDTELIVTPVIQPFCSTFELHERAPIVLSVCQENDTVEAVSEG